MGRIYQELDPARTGRRLQRDLSPPKAALSHNLKPPPERRWSIHKCRDETLLCRESRFGASLLRSIVKKFRSFIVHALCVVRWKNDWQAALVCGMTVEHATHNKPIDRHQTGRPVGLSLSQIARLGAIVCARRGGWSHLEAMEWVAGKNTNRLEPRSNG
jgi:hypothetical protein